VGDLVVPVGDLAPGQSRFLWLPRTGNATFFVEFATGGQQRKGCSEYVEGEMYHVRATVSAALAVSCSAELGVFSRVMIFDLF
jgi:hypothetical protein